MKYSADAVYEVVIYYYDSVKSKCRRQCVFCGIGHLLCDVRVVPQSELQFGMSQHFLHITGIESVFRQHRSIGVPLRYNNDKQKKPLFSRGLSVCRLLFNSFSKLKIDENYKEKRRLFY